MRLEQFIDHLQILVERLPANAQQIVQEESDAALTRMREEHFQPYPGGERPWLMRQGNRLFRRSGGTAASLRVVVQGSPNQIRARFSMTGPGVQTQEYGRAFSVRSGMMAIPVGDQLDARGVRRFSGPAEARSHWTLFRRGNSLMGRLKHESPSIAARRQFVLKRTVSIPARPVVGPEVQTAAERIMERLRTALEAA